MRTELKIGAVALLAQSGPASAKGCIKGAIVGGVAGHYAGHHAFLGAAAGCVAGRHLANRRKAVQTTGQATTNRKEIDEEYRQAIGAFLHLVDGSRARDEKQQIRVLRA